MAAERLKQASFEILLEFAKVFESQVALNLGHVQGSITFLLGISEAE